MARIIKNYMDDTTTFSISFDKFSKFIWKAIGGDSNAKTN